MAGLDREETFRQHLGSIFFNKDELETHFQTAITLAQTADDFKKLNTAVVKVEKEMQKLKQDINERATSTLQNLRPSLQVAVNSQQQSVAYSQNGHYGNSNNGSTVLGNASPPRALHPPTNQQKQQQCPPHGQMLINRFPMQAPEPFQEQKTKVFHHNAYIARRPEWATFRKIPNLPDSHMLFLAHISPSTTEETLFNVFSGFGVVADVRIFSVPHPQKWSLGAIGFVSVEVADLALREHFFIDGVEVIPRPYRSKDKRPQLKQRRYQIFLGGVPAQATTKDIGDSLVEHLEQGINDIRVVYKEMQHGNTQHRGFAYVDLQGNADAQYLLERRFVYIMNRKVECKPNTRSESTVLSGTAYEQEDYYDVEAVPEPEEEELYSENYSHDSTVSDECLVGEGSRKQSVHSAAGGIADSGSVPQKGASNLCIVCLLNPQNCVLLWCGHTDVCDQCGPKLKTCPKNGCGMQIDLRQTCQT